MDPASAPETPPSSPAPEPGESLKHHHRRTGFIAQLPKTLRDQISQMIRDGIPYMKIIEKLGDPVKHLNGDHFTSWKTDGGYDEWLVETQRKDDLCATRDAALSLVGEKAGATVQDAGRTIASAQLYELLLSFDPRNFAGALADKPELYFRLINSLARLSEGEAVCSRLRAQATAIEKQLELPQGGPNPAVIPAERLKELIRLIKLL
ncbi:MAG TPA: hypothetical protein VLT36_12565 [Candidatus Dormibacteraeota bacterium]|nr:hypothetical protein [Candidatus Dormibacteraeota bacterium]